MRRTKNERGKTEKNWKGEQNETDRNPSEMIGKMGLVNRTRGISQARKKSNKQKNKNEKKPKRTKMRTRMCKKERMTKCDSRSI